CETPRYNVFHAIVPSKNRSVITARLVSEMIFERPRPLEQSRLGTGNIRRAFTIISSCQEEILEMTRHKQEILANQLRATRSPPRQNPTILGLMVVAVFLVGIGVGDILSKTKQANTNYAALISIPNGQE